MKLKLMKQRTVGETALKRFNTVTHSYTDKLIEFKITLNNNFEVMQDLLKEERKAIMEDNWKEITEALTSMCQEGLGCTKHRHKEWIIMENLDSIQERKNKKTVISNSGTRTEKLKAQAEYTEADK
ncbi:unnamed protein product [Schistosoma curassoni]|uniref:Gag-pol polyprotein n=1 Tax=Schistosoma curassoni TaxID=6186 RepID=A0A183JL63_9TREM|nr:unnamed protein product [Schistosoma curassoni]